jgi:flap endonuclease-1
MGIKNLLKFLSNYPELIKEIHPKHFYGKKIAIDISILIYQVVISIRNSGSDLTNKKGELTSHILGLFNKTLAFLEKGIIPIYVFDGKPPHLKHKLLNTRKLIRKKALEKLSNAKNNLEKIKYFKRSVLITREHMDQCRELLTLMGIPYINAPEEADSELSYLCKTNMVYAVQTEDMDILTFGSPRIIRNLSSSKKIPIEIELNNILTKLNLTYEQFIELCILFGCDYCPNLTGIKFLQIYEVYNKHKNIKDTIIELKLSGVFIPDDFNYITAKEYFMNPIHDIVTYNQLQIIKPNSELIIDLLVNKYGLIKYKIIKKVIKLNDFYYKFKDI